MNPLGTRNQKTYCSTKGTPDDSAKGTPAYATLIRMKVALKDEGIDWVVREESDEEERISAIGDRSMWGCRMAG